MKGTERIVAAILNFCALFIYGYVPCPGAKGMTDVLNGKN